MTCPRHLKSEVYAETYIECIHRREELVTPIDDVLYFRADTKYVMMVTTTDEVLLTAPLHYLEERYGSLFVRVNRNAIVRRSRLGSLSRVPGASNYHVVVVGTDKMVGVSRRYRGQVLDAVERIPEPIPC